MTQRNTAGPGVAPLPAPFGVGQMTLVDVALWRVAATAHTLASLHLKINAGWGDGGPLSALRDALDDLAALRVA